MSLFACELHVLINYSSLVLTMYRYALRFSGANIRILFYLDENDVFHACNADGEEL